jgi:hypothetical protein
MCVLLRPVIKGAEGFTEEDASKEDAAKEAALSKNMANLLQTVLESRLPNIKIKPLDA